MDENTPERSRLDAKIKRDTLLKNGLDDLWRSLWGDVQTVCEKINSHWKDSKLEFKQEDEVIRLTAPPEHVEVPLSRPSERKMDIRLVRSDGKPVVRVVNAIGTHKDHPITADHAGEKLTVDGKSPRGFAEKLIAETLLKLDLS